MPFFIIKYCTYILRTFIKMNSNLKKMGLSDTKFQLKYHTPKCSRINKQTVSSAKQPTSNCTQQQVVTVLDVLVDLVGRKQKESCPLPDHDRNPIKFLCLEENCPVRAGCSYCFLDGHKSHSKIQSRTCLKDLIQLNQRAYSSRELLKAELIIKKQQMLSKLDIEIYSIKQQFLANLEYLNKKVREGIEVKFNQNMTHLVINQKGPSFNQKEIQAFRQLDASNNNMQDTDIISKFMLSSSKQPQPKPQIKSISKYPLRRQQAPKLLLSRQDEHQLLVKLSRLNLTYVQEYLKHETAHFREIMSGFRIYEQFYTELNSSLSEFFASFKRALPSLKTIELGLQEPQVLHPYIIRP